MAGSSGNTQLPPRPVPDPLARASRLFDRRHSPMFRAGGVVVSHPKHLMSLCGSLVLGLLLLQKNISPPPHLLQHHPGQLL